MSIPTRSLGHNGPQVPAVGLGLMSIGGIYGSAGTLDEKLAFLDQAHAVGQYFWDTADVYQDSEDIVGEWFKHSGKRDDIFLATKFGIHHDNKTGSRLIRSDPEYVEIACKKSLERLGVSTIDLYYCHRVDGVTPIEKTIEAMVKLKSEGKIRYLGISEVSAPTLRRAHAVHPITALQIEYSPFALEIESPKVKLLNTCRELGIAVVAYSPIGRGILTGQIQSFEDLPEADLRRIFPKYSRENFPKIMKLVEGLKAVAKTHDVTPAQVAIAWVLAQGPDIVPIPGTRSAQRMEENNRAALLDLSNKEVQYIRELIQENEVLGDRYPAMLGGVLGETPPLKAN